MGGGLCRPASEITAFRNGLDPVPPTGTGSNGQLATELNCQPSMNVGALVVAGIGTPPLV